MQMTSEGKNAKIRAYLDNAKANGMPKDAYLQLGYACNARCLMCDIWKSPSIGEAETLCKIIHKLSLLGFEWVTFWGGEPLIHPQIEHLMKQAKSQSLNLQIITNGAFIKKRLLPISKYADNIVVSIDSGIPDLHDKIRNKEGIYYEAVSGIRSLLALEKRPNIEIDCTIMNENAHTLTSVIELSRQLGGIFVDFDPVQVNGIGNNRGYKLNASAKGLDDAVALAGEYGIEITSIEKISLIKEYIAQEQIHMGCYSYCKDLLIAPNGDVHTCWTIGDIIGNILDADFGGKWHEALSRNKAILTGEKEECYACGFSHSRMPDREYVNIVDKANMIRLEKLLKG